MTLGARWTSLLLVGLGSTALLTACSDQPLEPVIEAAASGSTVQPPSNAKVAAPSPSQIDISWQDNSSNEAGFEVWVALTAQGTYSLWITTAPNVTAKSFTGQNPGQEYCAKVRAFTALGQSGKVRAYSAFSTSACATTPIPAGPSKIAARPLSSSYVEITWSNDIGFAVSNFRVERSTDQGATWATLVKTDPYTTRTVDFGVAAEHPQLCYRVIAIMSFGESTPSKVACTTPPSGPTNLTATGVAGPAIALAWTDNSAVEDGYQVLRAPDQVTFTVVATLPENSTSYRDAGGSPDTRYWYQVRATKDSGFSDASNTANAVAATQPPAAPTGVDAYPGGSTAVVVIWAEPSTNEDGFRIERSTDGQATWAVAVSADPSQTGFTDGDRASEQPVCYRVIAFNGLGDSPPSNVDCTTPPAAPSDLVATTVAGNEIDLTWTDHSAFEDGYEVDRVDCYYDDYNGYYCYDTPLATLEANVTSYRDQGLPTGVFVTYEVFALKDNGRSDPSNQAGASSDLPPPAPSNLTATAVSAGQIDLAWTNTSTTPEYIAIERCDGGMGTCADPAAAWTFVAWTDLDATTFSDTGLLAGATYTYRVLACTPGGGACSDPSNLASAIAP